MKYVDLLMGGWLRRRRGGGMIMVEYDGRKLEGEREWLKKYVIKDQYEKNRYILL